MPLHFLLGQDKRIIIPLDRAGWHITDKLQVPEGIHLLPLPSHSKRVTASRATMAGT